MPDPLIVGGALVLAGAAALAWKRQQNIEWERRYGAPQETEPASWVTDGSKSGGTGSTTLAGSLTQGGGFVRGLNENRVVTDRRTGEQKVVPHWGIDVGAPEGTPVYAASDGTIYAVGPVNGYGNAIQLSHADGQKSSLYAHLFRILVARGDTVRKGQLIGLVGRTSAGPNGVVPPWGPAMGPHLHFELHPHPQPLLATAARRLDPLPWLRGQGIALG